MYSCISALDARIPFASLATIIGSEQRGHTSILLIRPFIKIAFIYGNPAVIVSSPEAAQLTAPGRGDTYAVGTRMKRDEYGDGKAKGAEGMGGGGR